MKYFELVADKDISNPVQMYKIEKGIYKNKCSDEEFEAVPPLVVGYFEPSERVEIYDVIQEPAFFVSDRLKRLFSLFEPEMEFKGIQLFASDLQDKTAPLYWFPHIASIDCLSSQTKKYPNGMLEKMILDSKIFFGHHIFFVEGIFEYKVMVSLAVAESMIRRKISGISFEPVLFSGGSTE